MRRLDILTAGLILLLVAALLYTGLQWIGLETQAAQLWSSGLLMLAVVGWVAGYLGRVVTGKMTLQEQTKTYQAKALEEKLATMTPEELAELESELSDTLFSETLEVE
jgi:hypothetical protein